MESPDRNNLEQGETHDEPSFYKCIHCETDIALVGSNVVDVPEELDRVLVFANVINVAVEIIPPEMREEYEISPVFASSFFHAYCANCNILLGGKIIDVDDEFPAFKDGAYLLHRNNLLLK